MNLPSFTSYGNYSSKGYGAHSLRFDLPNGVSVYYSYKTPVAFSTAADGLVVSQNIWGTTTGKHLNMIDNGNKKTRIPNNEFNERLEKLFTV